MALSKSDEQDSLRKIEVAKQAMLEGDSTTTLRLANEVLDKNFDDPIALYLAAQSLQKSGRWGLAYNLFKRVSQLQPERSEPWNMAGMCLEKMWHLDGAEKCFKEALKRNPANHAALQNMSLIEINRCRPDEALKWIERAEKFGVTTWENTDNKAMALLMKRDWSGWKLYRETSGRTKPRQMRTYNDPDEPMWNGEPGSVVIYGNQGIGDEIAFSSCIVDACKVAEVIVDCDHRIANLFKRSFPEAKVYGTRFKDDRDWDHAIDYSVPVDCLPSIFRNDGEFPGTPFLKADPERRIQWRALFDTFKRPVIGVAWTGGADHTGRKKRSLSLEQMLPIFKSVEATWVSLEYRDVKDELEEFEMAHGVKILDYPRATRTHELLDYDDTAGLVSELDLVISVTTAVVHLSGGLGKECFVLVPSKPRWWYGIQGDETPWYGKPVKLFRQPNEHDWDTPIGQIVKILRLRYGS
jgi:tetratricopeptide (TPR) repeat protein